MALKHISMASFLQGMPSLFDFHSIRDRVLNQKITYQGSGLKCSIQLSAVRIQLNTR